MVVNITLKELSDTKDWKYAKFLEREIEGIKGLIVMFDITSYQSYEMAKYWINFVKEKRYDNEFNIILLANKVNMESYRDIPVNEIFSIHRKLRQCILRPL